MAEAKLLKFSFFSPRLKRLSAVSRKGRVAEGGKRRLAGGMGIVDGQSIYVSIPYCTLFFYICSMKSILLCKSDKALGTSQDQTKLLHRQLVPS